MAEQRVNILEVKSKAFALRIVKLYRYLCGKKESVLSKQILRSGTSIGANIAEGKYAQSRNGSSVFCARDPLEKIGNLQQDACRFPFMGDV